LTGVFVGNDYRELSVYVSFGLENYIGGKYGRSEEAAFGFLSSYVWNCYVMKIVVVAGNDLWEFSLNVSLGLQNCVVGKNG